MGFFKKDDDGVFLDVVKDKANSVAISTGNWQQVSYYHAKYLNKKEVFELITKLTEMYGVMDEED